MGVWYSLYYDQFAVNFIYRRIFVYSLDLKFYINQTLDAGDKFFNSI